MRKLTKLEKFGLIAAILVSGSYFYLNKVYDPQAKALKKTVAKLNSTIGQYNKLDEPPPLSPVKKAIEKKKQQCDALRQQLHEAGGRSGNAQETITLLDTVNRKAREQGLLVLQLVPLGPVDEELYDWESFELQITGFFPHLLQFIDSLKAMPQPIELRELSIIKSERLDGTITVKAQLLF
ncbi:type 4a pilus biogenesis protein PilO [uncultured Desulfuromonas sp.]|uniref:type 4a pilus biogenesis protein PilO n=1 Tax=uncultured Desulfuromonas sp. TaxID=181013 RepID=UPI002AAC2DF5|nr:type 4a pilus biogenesis protein PilO [uncultured Desulfuromonas sp.]